MKNGRIPGDDMVIAKIGAQEARGLSCAQGGDCAGPMWQVRLAHQAGPIVVCEAHLFRLGRGIADALKADRTPSEAAEPEAKPFTWG